MKRSILLSLVFLTAICLCTLTSCSDKSASPTDCLEVHFIDVGQAEAALLLCEGRAMLIDAGNVEDSDLIYTYLEKYDVKHLDYVVGTHPHEDHIGGMAGALSYATADKVFCSVDRYNNEFFRSFEKYASLCGAKITVPAIDDSFELGSATVNVLGCGLAEGENNSSIILRVTYGETSFLFMGDAELEAEQALIDSGADISATVLKVGHHGSNTSSGYRLLREVSPEYAVISSGKGNEYGHPHDEPLSRLRDADVTVYRTDVMGDIICTSDGRKVTFSTAYNRNEKSDSQEILILNTYRYKYHLRSCENASSINAKNREEFRGGEEELIKQGYSPAGCCFN